MSEHIQIETADKLEYQFHPVTSGSVQFKIRAANDAHVALTTGPQEADPMYEIFIGGWKNSKSVIRRNRTRPDVAEAETPDILNEEEFRGFWVRWHQGVISAGRDGEAEPFVSYSDPDPFPINYFGVCTGWGATGTWKVEGRDSIETPDDLKYSFHPVLSGAVEVNIQAPSNGHIALVTAPAETERMYEIILGGWDNTASVIRYCRAKPDKVRKDTVNLLHPNDIRRFYIEWHNGHVTVRAGTRSSPPLMEWTDSNPFGISHFGVQTAWGSTGKWRVRSYDHRVVGDARVQPVSMSSRFAEAPASTGAVCWVTATSGEVPPNAVRGGEDNGEAVYVARAEHEGALIPGKLVSSHGVAYIPWGGAEHPKDTYEVLCDCPSKWVPAAGGQIPPGAIAGGQSEDGEPLFIGRTEHEGGVTTGKIQSSHNVLYIPYGGAEMGFPEYEVLVSL